MSKNISVWGLGHVGLITTSFLCERGHDVFGIDHDINRLNKILRLNIAPKNLAKQLSISMNLNRLKIGTIPAYISENYDSNIHFVCVETPTLSSGKQDLKQILSVLKSICQMGLNKNNLIIIRSTILPSTTDQILIPYIEKFVKIRLIEGADLIINPSFSKHTEYEEDLLNSNRIIIGARSEGSFRHLINIYKAESKDILKMSYTESELTKYIDNCFHALKISFANEVGLIAESLGCDGKHVMNAICHDKRLNISEKYLVPGMPFGGECLPKDLSALNHYINNEGIRLPLITNIDYSNEAFKSFSENHIKLAASRVVDLQKA